MIPDEDRNLWSKAQFEAMLAVMMGGQAAEQIVFGDITTGASNDLQNANGVARKMVTEYGMSGELGPRTFGTGHENVFLGKEIAQVPNYSDAGGGENRHRNRDSAATGPTKGQRGYRGQPEQAHFLGQEAAGR